MKIIEVRTQKEIDKLPKFKEYTRVDVFGGDRWNRLVLKEKENCRYVARENSSVEAWENSSVVAWGNSSVVAWGNSSVVAWGNSSVEARENSSVEAWENSSVVAWGNSGVHLSSDWATVALFAFSVCWQLAKGKIYKKSKTCTVIKPIIQKGTDGWLEREAVKNTKKVILFKKVSKDWLTQEGTFNETKWEPGTTLTHHDWKPTIQECGPGKFHACSRTYFCDEFRSEPGDRYIAIEIDKKDLHAWDDRPSYPHKIAFKKGKVLYEVNKMGKKI